MEQPKRILVVDDEPSNRELLEAHLTALGHVVDLAADGAEALAKLDDRYDLVLLDVLMTGIDGFETVRCIRGESSVPDIPICMVTTLSGKEDRLSALEAGANDFISYPIDKMELKVRTASLLKTKEAQDAIKRHHMRLEATVKRRTAELQRSLKETVEEHEKTYIAHLETIERLAVAAEFRDGDSGYHIRRMSHYTELIARKRHLSAVECATILYASSMHDIGKIGVPDRILFKSGKLSDEEWELMKQHPKIGANILSSSSSDLLQAGEVIALTHHEKWDGSGYPQNLAGNNIPLLGRIAAIADVFDALTSKRPYKDPITNKMALGIMHGGRGSHFDPALLDLFFDEMDEVETIQSRFQSSSVRPQSLTPIDWPLLPRPDQSVFREVLSECRI